MAFLGDYGWDDDLPRPARPRSRYGPGYSSRDIHVQGQFLDADPGRHYRSRSLGQGAQPIFNIYNDMNQENLQRNASPGYLPYPEVPSRRSSSSRGRSRHNSTARTDLLQDQMALLMMEDRLRSRSRGRSDVSNDRRLDFQEYELQRIRRENERALEEERIRSEMRLKALQDEAQHEKDEAARRAKEEKIIADHDRKTREEADRRRADEQALRDKLDREKSQKAEKDRADRQAMIDQLEREKKAKEDKDRADRQALLDQLEREKKDKEAKDKAARQALIDQMAREKDAKEKEEARQWEEFERKRQEKEDKKKREEKEEKERIEREMRRRLEGQGYSQTYIDAIIKGDNIKDKTKELPLRQTELIRRQPVYAKIHRNFLSVDTLLYYNIPYDIDKSDPNYFIILHEMDKHETDVLFEHTRRLRSGRLLVESRKKEPQYAWYRRRSRSKSRGPRDVTDVGIVELR